MNDKYSVFSNKPWKDNIAIPTQATRVPTMLCDDESKLLFWLGANWYNGAGAICDLGCFAGGSTARLAAGLEKSTLNFCIHAYDYFTISKEHKHEFLYKHGVRRFFGENLLKTAKHLLKPWKGNIKFHKCDITYVKWSNEPIEILFVDAMKSPQTGDSIANNFYPYLLPKKSIIIQQDYLHWKNPWVIAQMQLLKDFFKPIAWADEGSVVFSVEKTPSPVQLKSMNLSGVDDNAMVNLLKEAMLTAPSLSNKRKIARSIIITLDTPNCRTPWHYNIHEPQDPRIDELVSQGAVN